MSEIGEGMAGDAERHLHRRCLDAFGYGAKTLTRILRMNRALDLAERITVLHYGSVIVEGTRAEIIADPKTREVYLGD